MKRKFTKKERMAIFVAADGKHETAAAPQAGIMMDVMSAPHLPGKQILKAMKCVERLKSQKNTPQPHK